MGTSEEMTKEERIEYWEMVLEDFNQSGLNKTCYCQNNDIPVSTLNYWSNRLRELQASKESDVILKAMRKTFVRELKKLRLQH